MDKIQQKNLRLPKWGVGGAERLALLRRARAVWSKRKADPIKELKKLRRTY